MNEVIELLNNHRSIRSFTDKKLDQDTIETLVKAAQSASTSSYVQAYSIIGVTDETLKAQLREVSGQSYVEDNGHLFVFVMDYNRHTLLSEENGTEVSFKDTEKLLVGAIDVALAAQNLAVAAESMGLGICYIGSLRNNVSRVIELLNLPNGVFPLFGMVVGEPNDEGSQKERLPFEAVYFENTYKSLEDNDVKSAVDEYDQNVSDYYKERTDGARNEKWSEQVTNMLSKKIRLDVHDFLKSQGFIQQ